MSKPLQIGLLLFPNLTQLDLIGPLQVFSRLPNAQVHLIWKRIEPVPSDTALALLPTVTFEDCPQLDVICVPGGAGTNDIVNDEETLGFVGMQSWSAQYVTSVCTGALVLGAAGLLQGHRATTHWTALDLLPAFGATPVKTRVCIDGNRVTGGGVTAGIDFGLTLASILSNQTTAEAIQLMRELTVCAGMPQRCSCTTSPTRMPWASICGTLSCTSSAARSGRLAKVLPA